MSDERYERGLATLRALHGPDGPRVLLDLRAVAPDLARFAIEGIGDLYGDATLDPKTHELATVAALTALGTAPSQLRGHIAGALDTGATCAEVVAVITQMYAYAGFPVAQNGIKLAAEVFREWDAGTPAGDAGGPGERPAENGAHLIATRQRLPHHLLPGPPDAPNTVSLMAHLLIIARDRPRSGERAPIIRAT